MRWFTGVVPHDEAGPRWRRSESSPAWLSSESGGSTPSAERGYILPIVALMVVPMLVMTAFAVDVGAWYAQGMKMQRAADNAALAAVVWMPDQVKADGVATAVLGSNGFPVGTYAKQVTFPNDRQVVVAITSSATRYFSSVIANDAQNLTRTSAAEYISPIPMGSRYSFLANDPDAAVAGGGTAPACTGTCAAARAKFLPNYWLNIDGNAGKKHEGDRYTGGWCEGSLPFGCPSTGLLRNAELVPDGYMYYVDSASASSGKLNIQVYDPAFVYQHNQCNMNLDATQADEVIAGGGLRPVGRYTAAAIGPHGAGTYCTGDQTQNGEKGALLPTTTYIVRAPDGTPLDDLDNPVICSISFGGTHPDNATALKEVLGGPPPMGGVDKGFDGVSNTRFRDTYRRWVSICEINSGSVVAGRYIVQVRTNADTSNPSRVRTSSGAAITLGSEAAKSQTNRAGRNRFGLRARYGNLADNTVTGISQTGGSETGLTVMAAGRFPIYALGANTTTDFYLARVDPEYAGHTVQLNFFDISDVCTSSCPGGLSGGHVNFTVIGSSDVSNLPTQCVFRRDGTAFTTGQFDTIIAGCTIQNVTAAQFDRRLVTAEILLPSDYTCSSGDVEGCWIRVQMTYNGTAQDNTTWSANILGDPVHLIE